MEKILHGGFVRRLVARFSRAPTPTFRKKGSFHMRSYLVPLAVVCGLQVACGPKAAPPAEAPPTEPTPTEQQPTAPPVAQKDDDPKRSDINISDAIRVACGLTDHEAHFAYNSASVRAEDRVIMKKLADCFTTGKLKGQTMRLVGHADPRGEDEYNMVLGGRRADNVAAALKNEGLPAGQVETTSRGEMDATGADEASWAKDRRVDIVLADSE